MLRWLATAVIAALLALVWGLPGTSLGRRGSDAELRADAVDAIPREGAALPDFELDDIDGVPVRLADFRGKRVLITFERSLDW
jgi:cytochrome oxidase Cu insertion factor (SCO1/SenC/PrrC family)